MRKSLINALLLNNAQRLLAALVSVCVFITTPCVSAQEVPTSAELAQSMLRIEGSVKKLRLLAEQTKTVAGVDREALMFRLDQRIIRLLEDAAKLARYVEGLPADAADRLALEKRLREEMASFERLLFQRIGELESRIAANRERSGAAGDTEKHVLRAYANSLEGLRLGYSAALVGLVEIAEILGIPSEDLRQKSEALMYQYAEKVSGRIELFSTSLRAVRARLTLDPSNAELQSAANEINMERAVEIRRLESLLDIMARLDIETVLYRSVLLRENKGLSLQLLDVQAVRQMFEDGWEDTRKSLEKNLPELVFNILIFLLILFIFRALARLVKRVTGSALNRSSADLSTLLKEILVSSAGAVVMVLGILVALSQVGISLGPALAGLGLAGFILGFALQDTLGNFAAGAMILIYRPYDVDDFVEVAGAAGLVKKMNLVSTTIITFDNQTLIIPNNRIWGDVIKNVTAQKTRRVDMEFGISYGDDIEKAESVLRDVVESHAKVLADPQPNIRVHKLGDSSVNFVVRPWTRTTDYWDVYWDITREVKLRFDREGISIPFPQRDVHLHQEVPPA